MNVKLGLEDGTIDVVVNDKIKVKLNEDQARELASKLSQCLSVWEDIQNRNVDYDC